MKNPEYHIGNLTAVKVWELDLNDFAATQLLPEIEPHTLASDPAAMDSRTYDRDTGKVKLSVHSWLLRGGGKTILIDAGGGNDKNRPKLRALDHLRTLYMERLLAAGSHPEEIDYVLLTHLHADHVGWNTRLLDNRWTPTFPNATVLCSGLEWRYGAALAAKDDAAIRMARAEARLGEPIRTPVEGVFEDSLAPVESAGCLRQIVVDGSEVLEGIRFLAAPGHSIDHAAITITSGGEQVILAGTSCTIRWRCRIRNWSRCSASFPTLHGLRGANCLTLPQTLAPCSSAATSRRHLSAGRPATEQATAGSLWRIDSSAGVASTPAPSNSPAARDAAASEH